MPLAAQCMLALVLPSFGDLPQPLGGAESEIWKLVREGQQISASAASAMELQLTQGKDDLPLRARLIGHYSGLRSAAARQAVRRHLKWTIRNYPETQLALDLWSGWDRADAKDEYAEVRDLWLTHIERSDCTPAVLANAAAFLAAQEPSRAEELLRRAGSIDPDNPEWEIRLGRLYAARWPPGGVNYHKALRAYLRALSKSRGSAYCYVLIRIAKLAARAGDETTAQRYALELLDTAVEVEDLSSYGDAMHWGHIVLARLALADGSLDAAGRHLLLAGKTPGSQVLRSFGPDVTVANALLKCDQGHTVLEYLILCRRFWPMGRKDLDEWIEAIEAGERPLLKN